MSWQCSPAKYYNIIIPQYISKKCTLVPGSTLVIKQHTVINKQRTVLIKNTYFTQCNLNWSRRHIWALPESNRYKEGALQIWLSCQFASFWQFWRQLRDLLDGFVHVTTIIRDCQETASRKEALEFKYEEWIGQNQGNESTQLRQGVAPMKDLLHSIKTSC